MIMIELVSTFLISSYFSYEGQGDVIVDCSRRLSSKCKRGGIHLYLSSSMWCERLFEWALEYNDEWLPIFFFFLTNLSKMKHKIHGSKPKTLLGVKLLHPPIYNQCAYFMMASGVSCTRTFPFKIVAAQKSFLERWRWYVKYILSFKKFKKNLRGQYMKNIQNFKRLKGHFKTYIKF